jgi:hypothetical protein
VDQDAAGPPQNLLRPFSNNMPKLIKQKRLLGDMLMGKTTYVRENPELPNLENVKRRRNYESAIRKTFQKQKSFGRGVGN